MTYAIRPAGPEDASGITALRRMPGVFEQAASLPSDRPRRMEELLRQPGQAGMFWWPYRRIIPCSAWSC